MNTPSLEAGTKASAAIYRRIIHRIQKWEHLGVYYPLAPWVVSKPEEGSKAIDRSRRAASHDDCHVYHGVTLTDLPTEDFAAHQESYNHARRSGKSGVRAQQGHQALRDLWVNLWEPQGLHD